LGNQSYMGVSCNAVGHKHLKKTLIILTTALTINLIGQNDYDNIAFGFGVSSTGSNSRTPIQRPSCSPYIFVKHKRHELLSGCDIYGPSYIGHDASIYGGQVCYKYYLLKYDKHVNLFVDANFQYVQFSQGGGLSAKYSTKSVDNNWYQNKSFINTYGLGLQYSFLKNYIAIHCVFAGGYNYFQSNISLSNIENYHIGNYPVGNHKQGIFFIKLGLSSKIWREVQHSN
jgi:hypothetical protein